MNTKSKKLYNSPIITEWKKNVVDSRNEVSFYDQTEESWRNYKVERYNHETDR